MLMSSHVRFLCVTKISGAMKISFRVCPSHLLLAKCDRSGSSRGEQAAEDFAY